MLRIASLFCTLISCWIVFFLIGCEENHEAKKVKTKTASKSVLKAISADTLTSIDTTTKKLSGSVQPAIVLPAYHYEPINYDTTKYYIYLTFDDGPQFGTLNCLRICNQLGVKSTFFMVGQHRKLKENGVDVLQQVAANYPNSLICNHSFTHANGRYKYFYKHPYMALQDFLLAQKALKVPCSIIRLPGNSAWVLHEKIKASKLVKPISYLLDSAGYNVIGWDAEWQFNHKTAYPVESAEKMARQIDSFLLKNKTFTSKHLMLLTHDRMFRLPQYADSLHRFISLLKQNPNYVFETADHYPNIKVAP